MQAEWVKGLNCRLHTHLKLVWVVVILSSTWIMLGNL